MGGCEIPRTDPSAAPLASNTRTLRWAEHLLDPVAVRGGLSPHFLEHPVPVPAGRRRCLGRAIASAAMHPAIHDKAGTRPRKEPPAQLVAIGAGPYPQQERRHQLTRRAQYRSVIGPNSFRTDSFLRHQRIGGRFLGISVTDRCRLRPSSRVRPRPNTMSGYAEFGPGQYLTDITPERALPGPSAGLSADQVEQGFMSRWQLSHRLTTTPWNASNLTHFLEIDVSGLNVFNSRPGTFLIPGEDPLDLTGRIVRGGPF